MGIYTVRFTGYRDVEADTPEAAAAVTEDGLVEAATSFTIECVDE